MSDYEKLSVQRSLNAMATGRAREAIDRLGCALPCHVTAVGNGGTQYSIVTVTFDVTGPWTLPPVTIPKAESAWCRGATQVGDFGMTLPADTYLGGIDGLGGGTADLNRDYGNLSNLVFVPVGSTAFATGPRSGSGAQLSWLNGPKGAALSDTALANGLWVDDDAGTVTLKLGTGVSITLSSGTITLVAGAHTWTFSSAGFVAVTDSSTVFETHTHSAVATGGGTSGPPVPGS